MRMRKLPNRCNATARKPGRVQSRSCTRQSSAIHAQSSRHVPGPCATYTNSRGAGGASVCTCGFDGYTTPPYAVAHEIFKHMRWVVRPLGHDALPQRVKRKPHEPRDIGRRRAERTMVFQEVAAPRVEPVVRHAFGSAPLVTDARAR